VSGLNDFLDNEYAVNAIYPHRHRLSAKVRSFIDLLVKHFHDDPAWADPCSRRSKRQNGPVAESAPSNSNHQTGFKPQQLIANG
jgi:hypothetical protein